MALSPSTVWEVRTTGSDLNGGGFRAGSGGVDYSQQNAPQLAVADGQASGTTSLQSATGGFTAAMVGNVLQIAGGALTAGFYEIVAHVDANTVTLDRSPGTGGGSAVRVGGALASITRLAAAMVAQNKAWVRAGTYVEPGTVTFSPSGLTPGAATPATHVIGYDATRGDITPYTPGPNRPQIRVDANAVDGLLFNANGVRVENLDVAPTAGKTLTRAIRCTGQRSSYIHCKVAGFSVRGLEAGSANSVIARCEASGGTGGYGVYLNGDGVAWGNYVHDCPGTAGGIAAGNVPSCSVVGNIVANVSGVGITLLGHTSLCVSNTVHGCTSHGIALNDQMFTAPVFNNILTNNGGYGLQGPGPAGTPAFWAWDGNAYFGNASGPRNNLDDAGAVHPVNGSGPYVNARDVALTGLPYVDAAVGDFRLNDSAGAGAACRGAANPPSWPGLTIGGHGDLGAVQALGSGSATHVIWMEG